MISWMSLKNKGTISSWVFLAATVILLSVVLAVAGGCQRKPKEKGPSTLNLFKNPGFEKGKKPWTTMATPLWSKSFKVTGAQAHSGQKSAYLEVRSAGQLGGRVFGVVQEVEPNTFPKVISGYYRVEKWQKSTTLQYLHVAVIADSTDLRGNYVNHQIRYMLGGIKERPYEIENAKFIVVKSEEPALGKWVQFKRDIAEDFRKQWGAVPKEFSSIRVLFEARYEQKKPEEPEVVADVYYDDLYIGP